MLSRIATLCLLALMVVAQPRLANAQQQPLNWAEAMFSELSHDFGTVARGSDTRFSIYVTNIYEEDVTINNVETTCGCTAAKPDKNSLKKHEKATIEIKMNTVKFIRQKDSNIIVTLTFHGPQGAASKTVRVPIKAYIRSDVVVSPEPGNADFGSVEIGTSAQRKLDISYAGREDWSIKEVKSPSEHVLAEIVETQRVGNRVSYQLIVTLKDTAPLGTIQDQILLITDDEHSTEVPVLVLAKVEPDIVVVPGPVVAVGTLRPGQVFPFQIVLRGRRPFTISSVHCNTADFFEVVQPSPDPKPVHVLPFKLNTPDRPGPLSEVFTIAVPGRAEQIEFKVEGTIAEPGT